MIAVAESFARNARGARASEPWQPTFLMILPQLAQHLSRSFRGLPPEAREEAVQEGTVNCLRAYVRLHRQDKLNVACPGSLARYAARQVCAGRTVCSPVNSLDPLSRYAQLSRRIVLERLDRRSLECGEWLEVLVEDRRAPILDRVALRIDIPAWLSRLSRRSRKIAKDLAIGFSTNEVARKYRLSAGRISQIRRELYHSWLVFQGGAADGMPAGG